MVKINGQGCPNVDLDPMQPRQDDLRKLEQTFKMEQQWMYDVLSRSPQEPQGLDVH